MLHELPITNVRLTSCHEDWQRMTPTEQGRHCAACDREVVDFTQASAAELAAARAATPDGRVCGRFRLSQLAGRQPVRFGLWARAFVLALALLFGQGLTAQQAWAQVQRSSVQIKKPVSGRSTSKRPPASEQPIAVDLMGDVAPLSEPVVEADTATRIYLYAEQMPQPPGGIASLKQYLEQRLRYPERARQHGVEGKVFVNFIVGLRGQITDAKVTKGIGAGCDEEALRLISQMPAWTPGRQDGRAVRVSYTLPVPFSLPARP